MKSFTMYVWDVLVDQRARLAPFKQRNIVCSWKWSHPVRTRWLWVPNGWQLRTIFVHISIVSKPVIPPIFSNAKNTLYVAHCDLVYHWFMSDTLCQILTHFISPSFRNSAKCFIPTIFQIPLKICVLGHPAFLISGKSSFVLLLVHW